MRKSVIIAFFLATAMSSAAAAQAEFTVQQSEIADRKAVFGTVRSVDVVAARVRNTGTVQDLTVDEGTPVTAGQVIATVADPKLALQLTALDARLGSLDAQEKLADIELQRVTRLRSSGSASQSALDEARTNLDVIKSNRAALVAERAVIAEQLAEGAVRAPADGRVLRVHVTEGVVVLPGEPLATIAAEKYVLRIELPERHARFIEAGDVVMVGRRGLAPAAADGDGWLAPGVIKQVYPEMTHGRVVADVEVEGLGDYFVGERARVYVATGQRRTIMVPGDFLQRRYGVTYVMVKDEGEVMVQPGQRFGDDVEILAGLRPGDVLVRP